VYGVWLWGIILSLQIVPLMVNFTDLIINIKQNNWESIWFDLIYIVVVISDDFKLIKYDKIFNTFRYDAKSVEGFDSKVVDNVFLTIITMLCLAQVVVKTYKFSTTTTTPTTTTSTTTITTQTTTTITTTITTPTSTSIVTTTTKQSMSSFFYKIFSISKHH
jgi:hypothetical protein